MQLTNEQHRIGSAILNLCGIDTAEKREILRFDLTINWDDGISCLTVYELRKNDKGSLICDDDGSPKEFVEKYDVPFVKLVTPDPVSVRAAPLRMGFRGARVQRIAPDKTRVQMGDDILELTDRQILEMDARVSKMVENVEFFTAVFDPDPPELPKNGDHIRYDLTTQVVESVTKGDPSCPDCHNTRVIQLLNSTVPCKTCGGGNGV